MRGGRFHVVVFFLCLCACSTSPPAPEAPPEVRTSPPETLTIPASVLPEEAPRGEGEPAAKPPGPDEVLRLQRELSEGAGADEERLRLALLHASRGDLEQAEKILSSLRPGTNRLVPYLDFFLKRQLGNHGEAARILENFKDQDRRAAGFKIERAALCARIRSYRDYEPAPSDLVRAGGAALLYVEPRNFALQRVQDRYILHLKYAWKLYDERSSERTVKSWENSASSDREDRIAYVGPVTEFYQSFKLPLPEDLPPGPYRLEIAVTDAASGGSDRVYVPITVVGAEKRP